MPVLTFGFGAPIAFAIALGRRRTVPTVVGLIAYSALLIVACSFLGEVSDWVDSVSVVCLGIASFGATAHLFVIRSEVWAPRRQPSVPVARMDTAEIAVNRARQLRAQARATVEADPMLAKRLGIGRPDLPRQFDDGGLVDLNHAPLHVLTGLPGVTETSARQIQSWVSRCGGFGSLGEVMLVIEISPTFEHHLREYVVFIP